MPKEYILDIGIGSGGAYLRNNTAPHEQRIGIDIDRRNMSGLTDYPDVIPVLANAKQLPFKENAFSRIEIVLPFGELMLPGLQNDHFTLETKWKDEYAKTHPNGWYPEFQRVLIPHGALIIHGDLLIDPQQVRQTSEKFFDVQQMIRLTEPELEALGTETVPTVIAYGHNCGAYFKQIRKKWEDTLTTIELRSKKMA